ncbi:AEL309Wp [Eremothecium gossypii ATCC 10895]|uniref:Mediator of RNA polymerase II transcription subunit 11 n=1 Tax=Eremothecium gossypii (strain ATCC 10895 / CBS 109.51 / FGSC 9923 / NRRL Y-1056) TaxID=284811 RepID=MED11_EREGS|nr:AEL309Wp [Eremothecium gossypii ATCC 10895]Q758R2.2 RecName: Full=Mediator of RNA polymerase II transcription subunit 11; AltName: Full=Mediator complex subunit 11 [Eremothecium gossypii ATCC 10895]AAS52375.2 AEL309Wp [Eremothecium gossypii ATCC 10895]AEY96672.1 FAEL309Wp [Eremothecium gossypii FDAG1]
MPQPDSVKARLAALDRIDDELCAVLQHAQATIGALAELKRGHAALQPQLEQHVRDYYRTLEHSTVALRNEIRELDAAVGTQLLPVNIGKRAVGQDQEKLSEQLAQMDKYVGSM